MSWYKNISFIVTLLATIPALGQAVFINEIHYDNNSTDVNEGVEIAGPAGTDLSCYTIWFYNGNGGATYGNQVCSGTIPDEGCGYGAINFTFSGIQNGSPDGICLYNTCTATVIQFLSYEGSLTATNGVANGQTSTDIGVTEGTGTAVGDALQLTGSGTTYPDFSWAAASASSTGAINTAAGQDFCTCTPDTEPTTNPSGIGFSSIDCNDFVISWTGGNGSDVLVVVSTAAVSGTPADQTTYTANATYGSGSTLNANEHIVYKGSGTSVAVSGLAINTTYWVKIWEYNGITCEENYLDNGSTPTGSQLTLTCVYPHITSVLINSCDIAPCSEGDNEIVFMNTGQYAMTVSAANVTMMYGSTNPPTLTYTDSYTSMPATIAALNLNAGCGELFFDADSAGVVPASTPFVLVRSTICIEAFDWSTFCTYGPIYVLFTTDATWNTPGNFKNTCSGSPSMRYFRTIINGNTYDYDFDACLLTQGSPAGDGSLVNFGPTGGSPIEYRDDDCALLPLFLAVDFLSFSATKVGSSAELNWITGSEQNNSHFEIERRVDNGEFQRIGIVQGNGTHNGLLAYSFTDFDIQPGVNYYRLKQVDYDGEYEYSHIAALSDIKYGSLEISGAIFQGDQLSVTFTSLDHSASTISVIDLSGRTLAKIEGVESGTHIFNQTSWAKGMYLIRVENRFDAQVVKAIR